MVITRQLNTVVSIPPYLRNEADKAAVIQGLISLQESLKDIPHLTWISPRPNVTAEQFVNSVSLILPMFIYSTFTLKLDSYHKHTGTDTAIPTVDSRHPIPSWLQSLDRHGKNGHGRRKNRRDRSRGLGHQGLWNG